MSKDYTQMATSPNCMEERTFFGPVEIPEPEPVANPLRRLTDKEFVGRNGMSRDEYYAMIF